MSNKLVTKKDNKKNIAFNKNSNNDNNKSKAAIIAIVIFVLFVAVIAAIIIKINKGSDNKTTDKKPDTTGWSVNKEVQSLVKNNKVNGKHHIEISVKDYGIIKGELDADAAPISVTNFLKLANDGFYNGLTFHRIISGFMIQGGDPDHNGSGGSKETIKGEFKQNGVNNTLAHTRGAISMARSNSYDSASSQFFIVHKESKHLDGVYAVFGYVTEGMDIVDAICKDVKTTDSNGTVPYENQPLINYVNVID